MSSLRDELAPRIVPVVLANLTTHYPYHDAHLARAGEPPHDPVAAHPAFGNSFDWHSSVHSHWTAMQLLEHFAGRPDEPKELASLRAAVHENLDAANLEVETAYLAAHPSYERPYGWAWAMMLAVDVPQVRPMAEWIAGAAARWLNVLPEPIRHGVHSNTAFSLGLMLAAARVLGFGILERTIVERAHAWFENDRDWPAHFERSGNDFLSPGLSQADLMRRVLPPDAFARWWSEFLPASSARSCILTPVDVPDVVDGHIAHLHGLNLSRAVMLARVADRLRDEALMQQARRLYAASVEHAMSGDYLATHWLATFAWDAAAGIDRASSERM